MMRILVICKIKSNATIQCLFNLEDFTKTIYKSVKEEEKDKKISHYLMKIFKCLKNNKKENLIYYIKKIKIHLEKGIFNNSQQHDCLEFMRYLFNQLENESLLKTNLKTNSDSQIANKINIKIKSLQNLLQKKRKWELLNNYKNSIINKLFQGVLINSIQCFDCLNTKYYFENFTELSVDLNIQQNLNLDLSILLQKLLEEEIIEGYECNFCKKRNKIKKSQKILTFPKILTICIKRFKFFPYPKKINNNINIDSFLIDLSKFALKESNSSKFALSSFIEHKGRYIEFGHYIAYCKNKSNDWIYFNDEKVKNNSDFGFISNRPLSIYALFFTRLD